MITLPTTNTPIFGVTHLIKRLRVILVFKIAGQSPPGDPKLSTHRSSMTFASFASFSGLSLRNVLGVPSTKFPIDSATFVSYVLPPLVCYIVVALLAITPQTRTLRVALWPLVALLALRAALSVDMSLGEPAQKFLNIDLVVSVFRIKRRGRFIIFPPASHAFYRYPYPWLDITKRTTRATSPSCE